MKKLFNIILSVSLWLILPLYAFSQQQDWDFYFTKIDDKPASVGLNLALNDTAPLADKTYCFWIIIPFNQSDTVGFPLEKENETLNKLEDELGIVLQAKANTIYAGRTTTKGQRCFYFYAKSLDSLDFFIEDFFKNYSQYKYKLGQRYDESWTLYFDFLYPTPLELQLIYNQRIVGALTENGDNPEVPHHIDHWMNFAKKKDVTDFIKALKGGNFMVEKNTIDKTQKTHPYILQISEENKTDLDTIDKSVLQLFELTEKYNGIYGGWETFVIAE